MWHQRASGSGGVKAEVSLSRVSASSFRSVMRTVTGWIPHALGASTNGSGEGHIGNSAKSFGRHCGHNRTVSRRPSECTARMAIPSLLARPLLVAAGGKASGRCRVSPTTYYGSTCR